MFTAFSNLDLIQFLHIQINVYISSIVYYEEKIEFVLLI